jgi:hypothetical protein
MAMKWNWLRCARGALFLGVLLLSGVCGQADTRFIRLRNGAIATPEPDLQRIAPQSRLAEPVVSGLYLLQFTNRVEPNWRESVRLAGHEWVHFIPDNAAIVRLNHARLSDLRALPQVRYIGPFQPKHKVDPRLTAAFAADIRATLPVKLLAANNPDPAQFAAIFRHLTAVRKSHTFSLGTTFGGTVNAAQMRALAQSEAVLWIEPASRMRLVDGMAAKIVAGETETPGSLAELHELGFDGRGVVVSVADSGLDSGDRTDLHPDVAGRVDALIAYGGLPDASDEHSHGTHVAGIVAGNGATGEIDDSGYLWGLGVAPGANLVIQRIFDGTGEYFAPSSNAKLTQDAVRNGAYIGSNSWGDDTAGQYNLDAAEFDALVRDADPDLPGEQPYVLEFSAGNAGPAPQSMDSPGVAKNVIATGAAENNRYEFGIYSSGQEVMADFSSRGPAEDGRIKPDITAPGTWIASMRSIFANDNNAWGPISDYYMYQGGTSQSGPHASGAAAIVVQWYRQTHAGSTPSPALVKAILINSAEDMGTAVIPDTGDLFGDGSDTDSGGIVVGDTAPVPNFDEGWGRIDLVNLIASDRRFQFVEQGTGLATGQSFEKRVVIGPGAQLKVTLVYTDVPGLPAAIPALVNDLDIEVVAPNGALYRGNAFVDGESVAGTPEGDRINNVEGVHIGAPQAGEWIVRVRGDNVVQDVHKRNLPAPEQDFVLVISGQLPAPGEGVVSWDREAYAAPATAGIQLVDSQLAGQSSVTVTVSGSSQTNGMAVKLSAVGANGSFFGTVSLVSGTEAPGPGQFNVKDGDELVVIYHDANPAGDRQSSAKVDLQPPLISGVMSTSQFGRVTITWSTGEPATSIVYFGVTNAVTNLVSVPGFVDQHAVPLPALTVGETYYFHVSSADAAGNVSTNLVDGRLYYRFVAPEPVQALLIYAPESMFADGGLMSDTPYPGIETWTGTLDALSVSYEVWDTSAMGRAPTVAELLPYHVVLWRPEELQALTPGIVASVTSYVQGGGSLFVSSFDLLTRLSEAGASGFSSQVLHVSGYAEDTGANAVAAVPGDPAGAGLAVDLNYDSFPSGLFVELMGIDWPDGPDQLTPATNAAPVFLQENQRVAAVRFPKTGDDSSSGRVVFCAFALEAVPSDAPAPNNRSTLVANALRFLNPELVKGSTIAFDQAAYTVPGNVVVEATDTQRAGQGQVAAKVVNGTQEQNLSLTETPRRGVFRGRFTLNPTTVPAAPGRLPAKNGDTLQAVYVDASNTQTSVDAKVDTVTPVISDVAADAAYNEATITWATDKASDALVRFGESGGGDAFLTRSAYSAELATEHEVGISGLLPDKTYYYKVVSRDDAGNMAVDDASGNFHTLRTLKPITPPWVDNLDQPETGWAVYNDSGQTVAGLPDEFGGDPVTGSDWQFGVPAAAKGVAAHTGTNVWATNLTGDNVDYSYTDLITPAIGLSGGSRATLRYWQYYDFNTPDSSEDDPFADIVMEAAQVALSTDNGSTWKDLATPDALSSDGWEEVTVDIGKYAGQLVRFRFNYQLFTFTSSPRMGWMLDDISVDMSGAAAGSEVRVTNNLSMASFVLQGPGGLQIAGFGLDFRTNAPPGIYTATWQAVPYYIAPAPQTNTLATNALLVFQGAYTFPDANANGISDLWEQHFFGPVAVHPPGTDSDGDGATDLQEFLAGTDPTNPASALRLSEPQLQTNRTVRFEWPSASGRVYQLQVSNDLALWQTVADAQRGTGETLSVTLSALDPRLTYYFRVRVTP